MQASEAVRSPALACCCPSPRKDVLRPRPLPDTSSLQSACLAVASQQCLPENRSTGKDRRQILVYWYYLVYAVAIASCAHWAQPGTHQAESR